MTQISSIYQPKFWVDKYIWQYCNVGRQGFSGEVWGCCKRIVGDVYLWEGKILYLYRN